MHISNYIRIESEKKAHYVLCHWLYTKYIVILLTNKIDNEMIMISY